MKTIMKGLVGLVLVLVLLLGALAWRGQSILARHWEIAIAPRTATLPPPDLAEGKRLATIRGCLECHGADLGGQVLAQAPIGDLVPPNLTRGAPGRSRRTATASPPPPARRPTAPARAG